MEVPMENVIRTQISDPVTQAVVENIMGTLPMKKPHVRCEDCNISFTSQTVLEAHLQGARHAKQVRFFIVFLICFILLQFIVILC